MNQLVAATSAKRFRRKVVWLSATLVVAVAVAWHVSAPRRAISQALSLLDQNPADAERLMAALVEERDPDNARAWLTRSRALLRLGRRDEAAGCIAMLKQPALAEEEFLLALSEEAQIAGVPAISTRCLAALLDQGSTDLRTTRLVLRQPIEQVSTERWRSALIALTEAQSENPDDWLLIVQAQAQLGDLTAEVQAYRDAVRQLGETESSVPFRQKLAERLLQLGEFVEARPLVEQLTQRENPSAEDWLRMAQIMRFEDRRREAIKVLDQVLVNDSRYDALLLRGILWDEEHEYELAERDLSAAIKRQSKHAESRYRLAQVLTRLGKDNEAKPHFAEHARLSALQLELLNSSAQLSERPNDRELIQRVIELHREVGDLNSAAQWERRLKALSN